jgi:hypothetical protein
MNPGMVLASLSLAKYLMLSLFRSWRSFHNVLFLAWEFLDFLYSSVLTNVQIQAYQQMGQGGLPKVTVIIAQKNHHTKLFQADSPDNVPPGKASILSSLILLKVSLCSLSNLHFVYTGTVVDTGIVHPRQYDFYMCAHAGPIVSSADTVLDFDQPCLLVVTMNHICLSDMFSNLPSSNMLCCRVPRDPPTTMSCLMRLGSQQMTCRS